MTRLLFSVEQWELVRRLRNSGLSKEQVCQAFDDLERMEKELGSLYTVPVNWSPSQQQQQQGVSNSPTSSTITTASNSQPDPASIVKSVQLLMAKNLAAISNQQRSTSLNNNNLSSSSLLASNNNHNNSTLNNNNNNNNGNFLSIKSESFSSSNEQTNANLTSAAVAAVNSYFSNAVDAEQEFKEIDDFRNKGEVAIHNEISFFVYKHDLKQSQIARMAGVNQAYVSKFLRGELFDLSENGKTLIYRWYLRFLKNPTVFLQAHNINLSANASSNGQLNASIDPAIKVKLDNIPNYSANLSNSTNEGPKRTRFSFKQEHLAILEKAFIDNQYPDQKKREELAKLCNEARNGLVNIDDHSSKSPNEGSGEQTNYGDSHNLDNGNADLANVNQDDLNADYQETINENSPLNYQEFIDDSQLNNYKSMIIKSSSPSSDESGDDEMF